ncbi:coniferyl aldehyde dehydrogenase [Spongiibacter sp. KMU-158]|uniref:Aldehyde dehydrogenase n=1 Tax=Spongiibacter pelagi TaxID=2760804 RepID=A0A927C4I4_9GAMM|nr:coniferyl aldehyde dehydrogenase [Spongiibacter pelagi]MBD2859451.1 coniferyl aldehyde dehydrogenase [Spongiibacter pelagi]
MNVAQASPETALSPTAEMLHAAHLLQKQAYLADPEPSIAQRKADLRRLKDMVNENREAIIAAINEDYGSRARQESLFAEIISVTDAINDAISKVGKWAKPQSRHVDWTVYPGASNTVIPQPLGCVGVIVPWNFPGFLSFGPLVSAFAAGNRAMVKMSENSRAFTRLLMKISGDYFSEDKLVYFEETGDVGIEFSKIPFDLLFFTGSGETGKKVMAAAAQNLTPVIMELGGKSPAVITPNYPLAKAVDRIMYIKQFNAGQICINVDYLFVHETQLDDFIREAEAWVAKHVPDIQSPDYTSIIDARSFQRLQDTLADAEAKGAKIIKLNKSQDADPVNRKLPLHLVLNTTPDMIIRQRESFGPLLMVMTYKEQEDVVRYVNAGDRPLAFYPFSKKKSDVDYFVKHIMSGGVSVNDALFHGAQHDMPFGGVGASGMGHYHGKEGFIALSKMRPVFHQSGLSPMALLRPPYGKLGNSIYKFMTWFKS